MTMCPKKPRRWLGGLILLAVAFTFWPGLSGYFILDDYPNILEREAIHLDSLDAESLSAAAGAYSAGIISRPLGTLSLALDHYFWGLSPRGFKLTNLLLHILNTLLVLLLVQRLVDLQSSRTGQTRWPWWSAPAIAAVWAMHPLQVSTVLYATQRMEILAVTCLLFALLFYIRARVDLNEGLRKGWLSLLAACLAAGLGLLSKETGVLFIAFAAGLEVAVFGFRTRNAKDQTALRSGFAITVAACFLYYAFFLFPALTTPEAYANRDFTWYERLLTQLRVLPMYWSWYLAPIPDRLLFFYDQIRPSSNLFTPISTLLGGLSLAGLGLAGFRLRHKAPLVFLGVVWFFGAHLLTSNVFSLELAFEHRNYFSLLAGIITVAGLLHFFSSYLKAIPAPTVTVVVILALSSLTAIHAATWGDRMNLTMNLAHINPESERAQLELGVIYGAMADGQANSIFYDSAVIRLERAAALEGASPLPEQALIVLAAFSGVEADDDWWESLIAKIESRPMGPQEQAAISKLLENRTNGMPVSDRYLRDVFEAFRRRDNLRLQVLANFGFYALRELQDNGFAQEAFREVARRASPANRDVQRWIDTLENAGYGEIAAILKGQAIEQNSPTSAIFTLITESKV